MLNIANENFDHPSAFDWELLHETFKKLVNGQEVIIPRYNYTTCQRDEPGIKIKQTNLIIFEGIFGLLDKDLRDNMDLKIFVHSDDDIRLLRRLKRDCIHRGRTVKGVLQSYNRFVKHAFDDYIKPVSKINSPLAL